MEHANPRACYALVALKHRPRTKARATKRAPALGDHGGVASRVRPWHGPLEGLECLQPAAGPILPIEIDREPSPPTFKNQPFLPLAGLTFAHREGGPRFPAGPIRGPGGSPGSQGPITGEQHRDWPATVNPIHPARGPGS